MFKLEFETTGAAFADEGAFEVCAVLRRIAERVQLEADGGSREGEGPIRDSNGNTIGSWSMDLTAD